ncbi:hypothetical protein KGQ19_05390 [Catenulispora sp. NL8]|uniref:Uncharacterized protein n=1 Tax=Catenulispora pinistramenti TaxID=2705254 RepID=A0ABS5KIR2_9ACTN|nr:hypothetical protein [Catenulispora pinistramenti]MBS2546294.1 hypothetical protein [Catenulispora pinistramenti]
MTHPEGAENHPAAPGIPGIPGPLERDRITRKQISRRRALGYGAAAAAGTAAVNMLGSQSAQADAANAPGSAGGSAAVPATAGALTKAAAPAVRIPLVDVNFTDTTGLYIADANSGTAATALVVTFNSTVAMTGTIAWTLTRRGTTQLGTGSSAFSAPAGSPGVVTIPLGNLSPDHYQVAVTVTKSDNTVLISAIHGLGVIRQTVAGVRPNSPFGLGIRPEGTWATSRQIAARMGVKWTRGVNAVEPDTVAPSPGVFWDQTAIDAARAEIQDWLALGITPIAGINYNMSWNVEPLPNGTIPLPYQNRPKDMVAHSEMVYHSIAPLQDLVENWELWNEPWVHGWSWATGTAQDYRDMTKLIWDLVKPDYPNVNLIGGGSVTYNRDIVYAIGSDKVGYIDGSVNHAYGFPDSTQYAMTKTQIKLDRKYGQNQGRAGQWQTELGTAGSLQFTAYPANMQQYGVARTLTPNYLLHMLAGAEENSPVKVFWFSLCYDATYSGAEFNMYDNKTKSPSAPIVAYSTMTRVLEDCQLLEELYPTAKSTWGFLFKHADGKGRAAIYADQLYDGTMEHQNAGYTGTLTLNSARHIRVYDYLGTLLADGSKSTVTLPLNPWEVLYFDTDLRPNDLKTALTEGAVFTYDEPVKVTPLSFVTPIGPGSTIDLRVENVSPGFVHANVTMTPPAGWTVPGATRPVMLAPGESQIVSWPAQTSQVDPNNQYPIAYDVTIPGRDGFHLKGSQTVQLAYVPNRSITVGGSASQWNGVVPVTMSSTVLLAGVSDTKNYTFQTAWDSTSLYVRAVIEDQTQSSNLVWASAQGQYLFPFAADSVQIGFNVVANPDDLLAGDPHYDKCLVSASHLFVATLPFGPGELHRQLAPGTNYQTFYPTNAVLPTPLGQLDAHATTGADGRVVVTRDDTNKATTYELAINWNQLPDLYAALNALPAGQVHEATMAVQVNDRGTGAHGATYWTAQNEGTASGCYNFAPFWGTGAQFTGGRIDTRWGLGK